MVGLQRRVEGPIVVAVEVEVVNVVDASNLERNLYFTVQLLEMGVPLVIALNMMDVARKRGISVNAVELSRRLGCPVVPIVATSGEGLSELKARMISVVDNRQGPGFPLALDEAVEQALLRLIPLLEDADPVNRRWLALKLLEGDSEQAFDDGIEEAVEQVRAWVAERYGQDVGLAIADSRYTHAHALSREAVQQDIAPGRTLSDRIDSLVLGRWSGVPLFLLVMYLMFVFTINVGGAFIDFFDGVAGALFVDGLGVLISAAGGPDWLRVLLADGAGAGLQVVATFIPIITALYLFLSVLEDSGYMARAAFVMDRSMRAIGLPGKAFVPLIVGFGCNVPAIMATRTLENERERKLTILMNPFMSCGARLPVYALFAAAFFPSSGQNVVFALYLTGIVVAVLTGLMMKKSLLPGTSSGFMMELPPYHLPTLRGVLLRAWDRVRLFIKEAGQVIVLMVIALNVLNSLGTDGSFGNEDSEHSLLSETAKVVTPLFESKPMYWITMELARRMGLEKHFPWENIEEAFENQLRGLPCTLDQLKEQGYVVTDKAAYYKYKEWGSLNPPDGYGSSGNTKTGKYNFVNPVAQEKGVDPLPNHHDGPPDLATDATYPFHFGNFRVFGHEHSSTFNDYGLMKANGTNALWINKMDAHDLQIEEGDLVRLKSPWGEVEIKAHPTWDIMPGILGAAGGFGHKRGLEGDPKFPQFGGKNPPGVAGRPDV